MLVPITAPLSRPRSASAVSCATAPPLDDFPWEPAIYTFPAKEHPIELTTRHINNNNAVIVTDTPLKYRFFVDKSVAPV